MKIGIFGLSADPPTNAHLHIVKQAEDRYKLDKIIFVPCGESRYKDKTLVASKADRYFMLDMSLENCKYQISPYELYGEGTSYLIDTLRHLDKKYREDELFLIFGTDCIDSIPSWKESYLYKDYVFRILFATRDFKIHTNIRSSIVRDKIKKGKKITGLVPEKVEKFIKARELYKETDEN